MPENAQQSGSVPEKRHISAGTEEYKEPKPWTTTQVLTGGAVLGIAAEVMGSAISPHTDLTFAQNAICTLPGAASFGVGMSGAFFQWLAEKSSFQRTARNICAGIGFIGMVAHAQFSDNLREVFRQKNEQRIQEKSEENPRQKSDQPGVEYYNCP